MTRPLTATERTVSLFTGKTDVEDVGGRARDGSDSAPPPAWPTKRKLRWVGGAYHAWAYGQKLGVFDSVITAGAACEGVRQ